MVAILAMQMTRVLYIVFHCLRPKHMAAIVVGKDTLKRRCKHEDILFSGGLALFVARADAMVGTDARIGTQTKA